MPKRLVPLFSIIALVCLALTAVPLSRVTQAQGLEGGPPDRSLLRSERPKVRTEALNRGSASIDQNLADASGTVKVMIELKDAPAAEVYRAQLSVGSEAQAQNMASAQVNRIEQAQTQLISQLSAFNVQVTNRAQRVFNAVTVLVDASRLQDIARLPSVKAIHKPGISYPDLAVTVPLVGAPQVWTSTGFTGKGLQIGIIDTGIDYIHTDFGGTGAPISYTTNITNTVTPGDGFPNAKVVGGRDFVGDAYNASSNNPANTIPIPDPDPMDCNGHGSHVAGIAAGQGVNANGSSFTGPYNASTPFNTLRIGPGVAPEAELFALRVFGCDGSVDDAVMVDAIEYSVDPNGDGNLADHLDVINLSIGGAFNSADGPTIQASDNASLAGVIVTGSAGNEGDTYYVTGGSSGNAARAISVASSQDSTDILDGFRINTPTPVRVRPGSNSANYTYTAPVSGDLVYPPTQRGGCQPFTAGNAALLKGKIALVDWNLVNGQNECGSATKANNAAQAGAIGVIMAYPLPALDITIAGNALIPSILVPLSEGQELKTDLAAGAVNVTLTDEYNVSVKSVDPTRTDTLSDFSSRGPRRTGSLLKPDIAAPGQTVLSAATGTGNQGASFNGTSMAAPHVAGGMALLRQLHPDWSVEELKALVMNTANTEIRSANAPNSALYGPGRVGAGRMTLPQAQTSQVVMYDAAGAGAVSVSFGEVEVLGTASATRQVRVVNKGTTAATYSVSYASRVNVPGVTFKVSPATVTLAASGVQTITVEMTADASIMQHTSDRTIAASQSGADRSWISEAAGLLGLQATTNGIPSLRLPIHAVVRPASDMQADRHQVALGTDATATFDVALTGQQVYTRPSRSVPEYPFDEISAVSAFELAYTSPVTTSAPGVIQHADLKNVGVASDIQASGSITDTLISFGIATHGKWSTPTEVLFIVQIDTNADGGFDFELYNYNLGTAQGLDATDEHLSLLDVYDANGDYDTTLLEAYINGVSPATYNTVPYNTSVMALPVYASDLGLTPANSRFNYRVLSYSRTEGIGVIDRTPLLSYDAAKPGLDLSGGEAGASLYFDLNNTSIPVSFDRAAYTANKSQGLLLLHHHNVTGNHDEVVQLVDRLKTFLPAITK